MPARPFFKPRSRVLLTRRPTPGALATDVMAGISVGLIALPLALALGIASVPAGAATPLPPPALGMVTAVVAGFLISALGGSRVQIGGPTAAFVPVVLLVVQKHGYGGLLLATMMAGGILVLLGVSRLGALIKFIPWPVTSGFTSGIAVSIVLSQAPDLLGIAAATPAPAEFPGRMAWLAANLGHANPASMAVTVGCVAVMGLWPRWGWKRIPGSLVAMVGAAAVVGMIGAPEGLATIGSRFGPQAIPSGLPAWHWPEFSWAQIRELIGPATAIALLGAIESLLSAVVADGLIDDRHDSNTELIAQGIANLVCPFFGGLPATGAIARTSANVAAGARSPLAGMVHAATLLGIGAACAGAVALVPVPAMAAVLLVVALRMGEWHELRRLRRMPGSDALVLLTTFSLTVLFDLVIAVEVGMVLAAILFIRRVSETTEVSRVLPTDELESPEQMAHGREVPAGVLVYRIFGPFLFGAAEKMEDALEELETLPRVLILRLHLVTAMDATALNVLESVVERFQRHGRHVILSGLHRQPFDVLRQAGFFDRIGRENVCAHFDAALARAGALVPPPPPGH